MPTESFSGSGTWTVPSGVSEVDVLVDGGKGSDGDSVPDEPGVGGAGREGGRITFTMPVSSGNTFYFDLDFGGGGKGLEGGAFFSQNGAVGGGGTRLRYPSDSSTYDVAHAGGGGGGGGADYDADGGRGGGGGGPNQDGAGGINGDTEDRGYGGTGGFDSSGGSGGSGLFDGGDGSKNSGGSGGDADTNSGGGGGGGGYYGGGGGGAGDSGAGGGGGSGYVDTGVATNIGGGTGASTHAGGYVSFSYTLQVGQVQNLTVDDTVQGEISLAWDDLGLEDNYEVYRAKTSGTQSTADYTLIATLAENTTTYTDTGVEDGERYFYRVRGTSSSNGSGDLSTEVNGTTILPTPTIDSLSYISDAQLDFAFTPNDNHSDPTYRVEMERDGISWSVPSNGATTPTSGGTYSYGPNSDNGYETQVGIDSSFRFRVRAETEHMDSAWVTSGTVYTSPIPPHNPSVSRPDANTFNITATMQTDIDDYTQVYARKDTGSGYSGWNFIQNFTPEGGVYGTSGATMLSTTGTKGFSYTLQISVGDTTQGQGSGYFEEDARYQFRLRNVRRGNSSDLDSEFVYADYGNNGNVYFEDDFESGDLSAWDTVGQDTLVESDVGPDSGFSGADEGTNYVQLDDGGVIIKNLGDLSGESDVIVKCAMAAGSLDSSSETAQLAWYDGSAWDILEDLQWEYNRQGWVEITAVVPSSWLSTDNRVRFAQYGGGGDYSYVDRVVVSDILHEYTKPAAPSGTAADTSVRGEITWTWTNNSTFGKDEFFEKEDGGSYDKRFVSTPFVQSVVDGEQYHGYPSEVRGQPRNGDTNYWVRSDDGPTVTAISILPAPSSLIVDSTQGDAYNLSWSGSANNGTYEVLLSSNGGTSFVTDANSATTPTTSVTTTEYNSANTHLIKVNLTTGHVSKETGTIESVLAGSVLRTVDGVVQQDANDVVMTDKP